jgi:hypothetical protein
VSSSGPSDINLSLGVTGSEEAVGAVASVEDKATEAKTAVDALGASGETAGQGIVAGAKPATQELDKVTAAEQKLEAALAKLGNAEGPRALARATRESTLALIDYQAAATKAGTATDAIATKVNGAETAIVGATKKTQILRETMAGYALQGQVAAEGSEKLIGAFGSLDSVMMKLKLSGGESGKALGEMGLKIAGVAGAFVAGLEVGKKFDETMKSIGVDLSNPVGMLGNLAGALGKTGVMGESASKWLNEAGKSSSAYGDLMTPLTGKVNNMLRVHQDAQQAILAVEAEMKKAGISWTDYGAEIVKTTAQFKDYGIVFDKLITDGQDIGKWAAANATGLTQQQHALDLGTESLEKMTAANIAEMVVGPQLKKQQDEITKSLDENRTATMAVMLAEGQLTGNYSTILAAVTALIPGYDKLSEKKKQAIADSIEELIASSKSAQANKEAAEQSKADADVIAAAHLKVVPSIEAVADADEKMILELQKAAKEGPGAFELFASGSKSAIDKMIADLQSRGQPINQIFLDAAAAAAKSSADISASVLKVPPSMSAISDSAKMMATQLALAAKDGTKAFTDLAVSSAPQIDKVIEELRQMGLEVPTELYKAKAAADAVAQSAASLQKWSDAAKAMRAATMDSALGIAKLDDECKRLGITMDDLQGRMVAIGGVLQNFATSAQTLTGNLNGLASASGQANDALGQGIGFQGQASIISLQWTQATKEELDVLKQKITLLGEMNDTMAKIIDSSTSWGSTLSAITASYDSGITSLIDYIQQLEMFETQIQKMYAGATGAAKAAVDSMIATIDKLIATAGSTPPKASSGNPFLDDLNRQMK